MRIRLGYGMQHVVEILSEIMSRQVSHAKVQGTKQGHERDKEKAN